MALKLNKDVAYYAAIGIAVLGVLLYVFLPKVDRSVAQAPSVSKMELVSDVPEGLETLPADQLVGTPEDTITDGLVEAPVEAAPFDALPTIPVPRTAATELQELLDVVFNFIQDIFGLILSFGGAAAAIWLKVKNPQLATTTAKSKTVTPARKATTKKVAAK